MPKLETCLLVAAVALVGLATLACKGKLGGTKADADPSTTTTTAGGGGGDVCRCPADDMCVEFDTHSLIANQHVCDQFKGGSFQTSGVCAKELRIGACRVAADAMNAVYFGGDHNDVHDSQAHCEETLHGVFIATAKKDIVSTWASGDLIKLTGYTILMPAQSKQETHGDAVSLERYSGYYGIMVQKGKMSASQQRKDAREASEHFRFESFVTDTPTKLVWKVRTTKSGNVGYRFALNVAAGGLNFTCESLTVFDNIELADANIASCSSIAKK